MYKKIVSGVVAAAMVLTTVTGLTNNLTANQTLLQASAAKLSGNELGEATFNEGKGLPWHVCESMTGKLKFNISNGTYNITIVNPGGESNEGESRWDCQFRHRGLTIDAGHKYRITYSVKASKTGHLYAKIGDMVDPDIEYWHSNGLELSMPTLATDATQADVERELKAAKKTGKNVEYGQGWDAWKSETVPANKWVTKAFEFTATEGCVGTGEYTFHFGGDGEYSVPGGCFPAGTELQFDNMSLIDLTNNKSNYPIEEPYVANKILVNQVGYVAGLNKKATLVVEEGDTASKTFEIINSKTGETVYTGNTKNKGFDYASGQYVHTMDFSDFNEIGYVTGDANKNTGVYYIKCGDATSYKFNIAAATDSSTNKLYTGMLKNSLNYFYQNRSGIPIESQYISSGDKEALSHEAGHPTDEAYIQNDWIKAYKGDGSDIQKDNGTLDVTGGWYDAGDHGKYVLNGGISVWTLQNMYERAKLVTKDTSKFDDNTLNIPESGNGYPDLLDEARYELEFMLKMQRADGMVYHKMHDYKWTGLAVRPESDELTRIVKPVSTCATLNLAAAGAQAYRLWKGIDDKFANQCLDAAKLAYSAAENDPENYAPMDQAIGGGAYGDSYAEDDFYWAACELYAATKNSKYYTDLKTYKNTQEGASADDKAFGITTSLYGGENAGSKTSFTWGSTAGLGTLTLSLHQDKLTAAESKMVKDSITKAADEYISIENDEGYGIPYLSTTFTDEINAPGEVFTGYEWGSNSMVVNNAIVMAYAADLNPTNSTKYASGVSSAMDYIFGRNAGDYSYVTGYGDHATQYVHHRFWSGLLDPTFPYAPDGVLSGGPNSGMQDPWIRGAGYLPGQLAPQLCYLDHIEAWSTNECTINWNSPFAWVINYLEDYQNKDIVIENPDSEYEPDSSIEESSSEESSEEESSKIEGDDIIWQGSATDAYTINDIDLSDWEEASLRIYLADAESEWAGLGIEGHSENDGKGQYIEMESYVKVGYADTYDVAVSAASKDQLKSVLIRPQNVTVVAVQIVGTKKAGDSSEEEHTHSYTSKVTKAATCTEDGVRTYTCECGDSYTEVIKATGHKFGAWTTTTAATCTEDGVQTRTCSVCGEKETRTIAATGHKYVETIVAPTTTEQGYTLHKCSVCGHEYKDNFTDPVKEPTTLSGKVASQYNTSGDLRFIAMIKSADAAGADVAYYDLKVDGKLVERVPVTKTYKSYVSNGKTQQAPAGANFIITKNLSNLKNGQKATFELYFSNFDYPLTRTITVNK